MNREVKISSRLKSLRIFSLFLVTYIILCGFVIIFPYEYYDSDSSAYSSISQKLAFLPLSRWCAPEWGGHGGNLGYFRTIRPESYGCPQSLSGWESQGLLLLCAPTSYICSSLSISSIS